jgi:hypothetical protein
MTVMWLRSSIPIQFGISMSGTKMQRQDLEPGNYEGWQAIDATPQEESDGVYR